MSRQRRVRALEIPGPAGPLEALLDESHDGPPTVGSLVCHPHPLYGGTLHNKVAHRLASTLSELGGAALRFNFRGAGRSGGTHDRGKGEAEDARAALHWLRERHPSARLWLAGFSFGSWVAARVGAEEAIVERLVLVAPPVSRSDFSALERCAKPKLVIQGEADDVCRPRDLGPVFARWAEPKTLVSVAGANHFFDRHLGQLAQALREHLGGAAGPVT